MYVAPNSSFWPSTTTLFDCADRIGVAQAASARASNVLHFDVGLLLGWGKPGAMPEQRPQADGDGGCAIEAQRAARGQ
ncbi:MAG: hypothetical protein NZL99_10045 [Burkholderiaceae bacterium]|nr:hypothetical protein [Burkholderiaceae bacterium]